MMKLFISGHTGMVGGALVRRFSKKVRASLC
jgi:nucleoside-diphosphate-sugar epimerase